MRRGSSDAARTADGEPPGGAPIVNRSHIWFVAAGVFGTVHGLFSLYWASGGRWLLETVGEWAIELAETAKSSLFLGLGVLGVVKVLAAWLPLVVHARADQRRGWRALFWIGAVGLTAYGLVNTVTALGVLAGVIKVVETDRLGLMGHAFLWDPLFALWGITLAAGLVRSRSASLPSSPTGLHDHGTVFTAKLPREERATGGDDGEQENREQGHGEQEKSWEPKS